MERKPILGWGLRDLLFGKKRELKTKYKTVKYVFADQLRQEFLIPVQEIIQENGESARSYVLKQSNRIANSFNKEFKHLDEVLKHKLVELESFATDQEKAEERIKESERRLKWLETIKERVESILEI